MSQDIRLTKEQLSAFIASLFLASGFNPEEAALTANSLVLSELLGHASHGLVRVEQYLTFMKRGEIVSNALLEINCETLSSLTINANLGIGQVVMPIVLEKLYTKLTTQAVVTAAVRNCGHIGRLGEWVAQIAHKKYACLLMVNDNGNFFCVAPPGGRQGVTSTNPIAYAIPLPNEEIFMADLSTSAIAVGKVRVAQLAGKALPPHCVQDANGHATTDPAVMFADPPGTILPMGGAQGYKGFALSMFVDLLVAGLSGGQTPPATAITKGIVNNLTLIAWNPAHFAGLAHLEAEAQKYITFLRNSVPLDPAQPIRLPGDRMKQTLQEHSKNGILISTELARELKKLAQSLHVMLPDALHNS